MTKVKFQEIDIFEAEYEYANEAAYSCLFSSSCEFKDTGELQDKIPQIENDGIEIPSQGAEVAGQSNEDAHESIRRRMGDLACNKAGTQGIDAEKVNQIIYEATKGTPFFENEARKDAAVSVRIGRLKDRYEALKKKDLSTFSFAVDNMIYKYERERDLSHTIVHVDMDAFYASVEERDYPELKNVPIAVGDNMMLSTSSYEARKYTAVSNKIREIFARYDPNFSPVSLDEAYLDVTSYIQNNNKSPEEISQQIRNDIFVETKLTASAGIGANMLLAKIMESETPVDLRLMGIRLTKLRPRDIEMKCGVKRYFPVMGNGVYKKIRSEQSGGEESANNVESPNVVKNITSTSNSKSKWHEVPAIARFFKCPNCERQYINEKIVHVNDHLDQCPIRSTNPEDFRNELILKTNVNPTFGGDITPDTIDCFCSRNEKFDGVAYNRSDGRVDRTLIEISDGNDQQPWKEITNHPNVNHADVGQNDQSLGNFLDTENIPEGQKLGFWECPICQKVFKKPTYMRINSHVDVCLRKGVLLRNRR
ncbi:2629_t:CDS:2 [Acaulospora colombiana]|uniref:2629_t:CDS:1 n=1 Tax=Acaulospora colombiana TaxID=27376 RepID=A0ACA9L4I5_9GLOM|nr:2629_t:CDS:2 [Acaulospora colombiana]